MPFGIPRSVADAAKKAASSLGGAALDAVSPIPSPFEIARAAKSAAGAVDGAYQRLGPVTAQPTEAQGPEQFTFSGGRLQATGRYSEPVQEQPNLYGGPLSYAGTMAQKGVFEPVTQSYTEPFVQDLPTPFRVVATELGRPMTYLPAGGEVGFAGSMLRNVAGSIGAQKLPEIAEPLTSKIENPYLRSAADIGTSLLGGTVGYGAVAGAQRGVGGLRRAAEVTAEQTAPIVGGGAQGRVGLLTQMPDTAQLTQQLGRAPEVNDILQIDRVGRREITSVANRLRAQAELDFGVLGKTAKENGNVVVRGIAPDAADVARGYKNAPLVKVLEKPANYNLTAEQQAAAQRLASVPQMIANERSLAGVAPNLATVEPGEQFMWRKAIETSKGIKTSIRGGSARLGGGADKSRVFDDIDEALDAGVKYAHPLEAFDANVQRGLKRVVDARVKSLLEPLSETAAQRVSPGLRAKHDGLVRSLASLKQTGSRLDARIAGIVDAYTGAASPDIDALFDELQNVKVGLSATGQQGRNFGKTAAEVRKEIGSLQSQIKALQPDWRREVRLSKNVPAGRATVSMEAAPALAGRDFAPDVAQRIEDYYTKTARIRVPFTEKSFSLKADAPVARVISGVLTPIKATGDLSALLSNNVTNVARHPVMFSKNVAIGMRDMVSDTAYNRWFTSGVADDATRSGVFMGGPSGEALEFQFNNWMDKIPGLKQVNNHYTRFNNRMRVDMFNQEVARRGGAALSEADREAIARAVNRFTGVSNSRATNAETLVSFAPNFTRAHIESVAKALTDGTIEGSMAREHLGTMLAAGGMLVLGDAVKDGRDPSEVLAPLDMAALKRGEIRMNPNFMTVRAFGQDVKVFGKYDSLMRLLAVMSDSGLRAAMERSPKELFDALGYYTGSQGNPVTSLITNIIMGKTFEGREPLSLAGLGEQFAPITTGGVSEAVSDRNIGAGIVSVSGAKTTPMTPAEIVKAGGFDTLKGEERLRGIPAYAWTELSSALGLEDNTYYDWKQATQREYEKAYRNAGMDSATAQAYAERAVKQTPIYRMYSDFTNKLEEAWVIEYPDDYAKLVEREMKKEQKERRLPSSPFKR